MTSFKCCTASTKSFSFTRNIHTHIHPETTVKLGEIIAHNYLKTTIKAKANQG